MLITSTAATNVGRVRENNEDNFFLCGKYRQSTDLAQTAESDNTKRSFYLFGVCDGMGGEQYGELASLIAVKAMDECWKKNSADMDECIQAANLSICSEIEKNDYKRIGTTFASVSIVDDTANICNVGDSRIYLIRGGAIEQLSVDHTQAQLLVRQGLITPEQAKTHRDRNVLTQHLGIFPDEMLIEPFKAEPIKLLPSDTLLLCSDGLTDMLTDSEILRICDINVPLKLKADMLIYCALRNGGRDNVTVVLAQAEE